jgi:glycine oxidase
MAADVDVLVVGAGVIGLASAVEAARRGLSVRVVERRAPGAGATPIAAGILSPSDPREWRGERGRLNRSAMEAWAGFAAELAETSGTDPGLRRPGSLRVARYERDFEWLDAAHDGLRAFGHEHERLDAAGVMRVEPGLRDAVAGVFAPGDAHVDTQALIAALEAAARAAGVLVSSGVEPTALHAGAAVDGVVLGDGTHQAAGKVVLATGAWSGTSAWLSPELRPPVRPVFGEMLLLAGEPACRHVVRTPGGSIVPRDDGRHWVGVTYRDEGFADAPTAAGVHEILDRVLPLLPALGRLRVERVAGGLRPIGDASLPFVGPSPLPGLIWATGHGREGIIQAPVAARTVADLAAR